ncbi:MAG: Asp-tRNA(Asn)/Glu-tRNA(Gln) amidotransferase subunit GatA [Candidatus Zambryskibacteria bacterium]|nr:Asp-tRNA(Asn)/Glu-tRNA(Gln) amidotransferase subunit GatA [Candidatus Zambryskibacteria bacterium]
MIDLSKLTIKSAAEALKKKDFSAREITEASLNAIKEKDGEVHAFLEVFDDALFQADEADRRIADGEELSLLGVPIAIKDNMLFSGHCSTAGSKILEGFTAPYDATAIKKLKEAGAILVGRTNMDEFAMGSSTENSAYSVTRNPHDLGRVPGGSSGGSAAALAGEMVLGSLGSDTGGSIRQPAAHCGVVGLKTTYGRVSRHGLIALASSFDQIGPFAKTVTDAEIIYDAIKGRDSMDSTSIDESTYAHRKEYEKVIGVPRAFVEEEGVSAAVRKNFDEAVEKFESLGYKVVDISLPSVPYSLAAYYIILPAEVSSNLARFDGVKYGLHVDGENSIDDYFKTRGEGFGRETRRRLILGTYVLSSGYYDAYYGKAQKAKELITSELRQAFRSVDLIMTPTTPASAFKFGEKSNPLEMYLEDIFTVHANVSGCPAISLPFGKEGDLPLGIELTADLGREDNLFMAGKDFLGE